MSKLSRKTLSLALAAVMLLSMALTGIPAGVLTVNAAGGNWAGDGTQATPYLIEDAADLAKLAETVNSGTDYQGEYFKLTTDIDLSGFDAGDGGGWRPIGTSASYFRGSFDGNGYKITGLSINRTTDYVGLFGCINNAVVKNLGVETAAAGVTGGNGTGVLVGYQIASITDCYATGNVTGSSYVGGLVGYQVSGSITNSYATGNVSSEGNYVGGLMGYQFSGSITNSYATGNVTGSNNVGGLVGYQYGSSITNCYAAGSVTGNSSIGGLVGFQYGTITGCYFDIETTEQSNGVGNNAGATGVTGLTTAEMMAANALTTMSGLGTAFEKRATDDDYCYYPELKAFKTNGTLAAQAASKASVTVARRTPAISTAPTATTITYGQTLSSSTLSGTAKDPVTNSAIAGTFAWNSGADAIYPAVSDSGSTEYGYTFTPTYSDLYKTVAGTTTITVSQAGQSALSIVQGNQTKTYGDVNFTLTTSGGDGNGAVTWVSSDPEGKYISITDNGGVCTVTVKGATPSGSPVTITATKAADANYKETTAQITLTVNKKELTVTAESKSKNYGEDNPTLTFSYSGFITGESKTNLTAEPDISTTAEKTSPAGSYPITLTGGTADNYYFTLNNGTLTVNQAGQATLAITEGNLIRTYGDADFTLTITGGSGGGAVTWASSDHSVASINSTTGEVTIHKANAAAITITATKAADANYKETTAQITLTVNKKELTVTADNQSKTYGEDNPELTFLYSGFITGEDKTFITEPAISTAVTQSTDVGSYPIILTGGTSDNYSFTLNNGTLTVNKAGQSTFAIDGGNVTKTYGADTFTLMTSNGAGGAVTWASDNPAVAEINGATGVVTIKGAGAANITATSAETGNYYEAAAGITVTVNKKELTITADDQTKVFGTANPALTLRCDGFVNGDAKEGLDALPELATTATLSSAVGTYPVTLTGGSDKNYTFTLVNGVLTVTAAEAERVTIESIPDQIYTGSAIEPALTVKDGNTVLQAGTDYDAAYSNNTSVGTAIVTVTLKGDYTGTVSVDFTIKYKPSVQDVIDMINNLPDPDDIKDRDAADKVSEATNDYESLTDDEKDQIPDDIKDKLKAAQEKAGEVNHTDGDVTVTGDNLPWNVRLVLTPIAESDSRWNEFFGKMTDKKLLVLYDIKLIDTLTGNEYELPAGETVTVTIGGLTLTGAKNIIIAHEKADGTVEYLTTAVSGDTVSFKTSSFSLFGVVADKEKVEESESESESETPSNPGTGDNSNMMLWLLLGGASLTVLGLTVKRRKRYAVK